MKRISYIATLLFIAQISFGQGGRQMVLKSQGGGTLIIGGGGTNYNKLTFTTPTTDYTLSLTDSVKQINMNVASVNIVTVPANSTAAFSVGTVINIYQYGAGKTTITPAVGVTVRSAGARYNLYEQYSSAILTKIATNEWLLVGDLNF